MARYKEPVLDLLVSTSGHHWKINSAFSELAAKGKQEE